MASDNEGRILVPAIIMILVSILLFWLPVAGPIIAGFIGGRKANGVMSALIAALLPSIIWGVLLFLLGSSLSGIPIIGAIAGAGGFVLSATQIGPLLLVIP